MSIDHHRFPMTRHPAIQHRILNGLGFRHDSLGRVWLTRHHHLGHRSRFLVFRSHETHEDAVGGAWCAHDGIKGFEVTN